MDKKYKKRISDSTCFITINQRLKKEKQMLKRQEKDKESVFFKQIVYLFLTPHTPPFSFINRGVILLKRHPPLVPPLYYLNIIVGKYNIKNYLYNLIEFL